MTNDTQTLTLTEFLLKRIDEDVANAWSASGMRAAEFVKTRANHECEAKRRIVDACAKLEDQCLDGNLWSITAHDDILVALALPYADHPDYREEWRA